jgi:putative transposase
VVKPTAKKPIIRRMIEHRQLSERTACRLVGLSRTGYRYQAKRKDDQALKARLKVLAAEYSRYGYLMLHGLLKAEGLVVNKKRTYRIYTNENLQVRTRKRKKLQRPRLVMVLPTAANQRWSMDFVSDQLSYGRRFRVFNIVDDFTKEMVGQLVSVSITGKQVARFLNQISEQRPLPNSITCDNGTEFTSKAMFFWSKESGVKLGFIQPGKPTQNAFIESLNGKFRNECLNQHWFRTLDEAKQEIDRWREHYNNVRPHSSLGYLPPVEFAKRAA